MIIEEAVQIGNPIITTSSKDVSNFHDPLVQKIIQDLIDSLEHQGLVGIAAPQIGYNLRTFVTQIRKTEARPNVTPDSLRIFINPTITYFSEEKEDGWEGCGSVANSNLFGLVERSKEITVKAFDQQGKEFSIHAQDLLARAIQHENDHLDGIVFMFKLKDPKQIMSRNEYIQRIAHKKG